MSGYFDSLNRRTRKVSVLPSREAAPTAGRPAATPAPQVAPPVPPPAPSTAEVAPPTPQVTPPPVVPAVSARRAPLPVAPQASLPATSTGQVTIIPCQAKYLEMRERLLALTHGKPLKVIVFAGCNGGEGCTHVVREFAQTLAASGLRVLLIDADGRTSGLTHAMAMSGTDLTGLVQQGGLAPASDLGSGQLTVIPSPTSVADKEHFFREPEFAAWLDAQRGTYDYVLLDAPPLLRFSDAVLLGSVSDGVVILAQAEATERDALTRARDLLRRASVNVLGVVLNRVRNPVPLGLRPYLEIE
jgi:protein-tyrosine kinase